MQDSVELIDREVRRKNDLGIGTLRLQNRARLMRQMIKKLESKLKHQQQLDYGKERNQEKDRDAQG